MNPITRRSFGKLLMSMSFFPLTRFPLPQNAQEKTPAAPDTVAGYKLTAGDKELTAKFLATHEKSLAPLRQHDLPNDLPPDILYASPQMTNTRGRRP